MALVREDFRSGQTLQQTYASRQKQSFRDAVENPQNGEREKPLELARYLNNLYKDAVAARQPYETFDTAWDLFIGTMFPSNTPKWKATIVINKIRAFIIFMQSIMTDNKPRITVEPIMPGTEDAADLLGKLVDRTWDEEDVQHVNSLACLYGLIWGTGFTKIVPRITGKGYECSAVVPYRIFMNASARDVSDAEYVVHVEEQTLGWIRRNFPEKANTVAAFIGLRDSDDGENTRDFIHEGDPAAGTATVYSAQNISGVIAPAQFGKSDANPRADADTIEVKEFWFRDDTQEYFMEQVVKDGEPQMKDDLDEETGLPALQVTGTQMMPSPIDGLPFPMPMVKVKRVPVMKRKMRSKFPNGRLALMAGPVVLRDIPNPFRTNNPFSQWKNVDVGAPFGQGEAIGLKDTNIAANRLISQLYDILEKTGNPSFKVKKGAGVDPRSIKNKAGAIIPLDDMAAIEPLEKPQIPKEFIEAFGLLKGAMGEIAGLQDSVMGQLPGGNTSFATVDQLQESGSAPLRLKVRNYERMLRREGDILCSLIQQYDRGDRPIRERVEQEPTSFIEGENGEMVPIVANRSEAEIQFRSYTPDMLQAPVEFRIEPVSSLSTSPAGLWSKYFQLYSAHLIDAQAFHEKFRLEGWKKILARMAAAQAAAAQAKSGGGGGKSKPGPASSKPARSGKKPTAPPSNLPSRLEINAVR